MADEIPVSDKPLRPVPSRPPAPKKLQKKPFLIVSDRETAGLENTVSKLIMQGYRPQGSMVIQMERDEAYYYQPMVLSSALK